MPTTLLDTPSLPCAPPEDVPYCHAPMHAWSPERNAPLCGTGSTVADCTTEPERVTCPSCKTMRAAIAQAAKEQELERRLTAVEVAVPELTTGLEQAAAAGSVLEKRVEELAGKVRALEHSANRPRPVAAPASMPPWYGVFVTGATDPLVATFEYSDQAHRFVRDHYKGRAEVREVPAPGAVVVNEADLRGTIEGLEAKLREVERERDLALTAADCRRMERDAHHRVILETLAALGLQPGQKPLPDSARDLKAKGETDAELLAQDAAFRLAVSRAVKGELTGTADAAAWNVQTAIAQLNREREVAIGVLKKVGCQISIEHPLCREVEQALKAMGIDPATTRPAAPAPAPARPVGAP